MVVLPRYAHLNRAHHASRPCDAHQGGTFYRHGGVNAGKNKRDKIAEDLRRATRDFTIS